MKNSQIENWALQIIERVEAKQPIEDSRVELKAEWPEDSAKAARRIAGHANAARGEHILWLIGVDENTGVKGADYSEMSTWFNGVISKFDDLHPHLYDLNIPITGGKTVVALLFETDRAPYVVKNPQGGAVSHEVPWREGTSIRSAKREDLLKLLTPIRRQPIIEIRDVKLISEGWSPEVQLYTYFKKPDSEPINIPFHKCSVEFKKNNNDSISSSSKPHITSTSHSSKNQSNNNEVVIYESGEIEWGFLNLPCLPQIDTGKHGSFIFQFEMIPIDKIVKITCVFEKEQPSENTPEGAYKLISHNVHLQT